MGEDVEHELKQVEDYFLKLHTPKVYNPYDERCVMIVNDKQFEELCNTMDEAGSANVRGLTVFQFFSRIEFLEKKAAKHKQHGTR